ncbi:unnamed protein product [Caenorhabditis sp. 36 PRJEB53466]|nr:unnamed protein product [Caenorhabditis sp. 36 PRJEB53466]
MKVPQYLAEIVSEFSGFHHTPDFKASRSTGDFEVCSRKSSGKNSRRSSTESKHSINISVGVDHIPTVTPSDLQHQRFVKSGNSSSSISRMASLSSVQEKLQRKLKRSASCGSEDEYSRLLEAPRKVSSYRVIA